MMDQDEFETPLTTRQWLGGWALIFALCAVFWAVAYWVVF